MAMPVPPNKQFITLSIDRLGQTLFITYIRYVLLLPIITEEFFFRMIIDYSGSLPAKKDPSTNQSKPLHTFSRLGLLFPVLPL